MKPSIDQLKKVAENMFPAILTFAGRNQKCKRKSVGCAILKWNSEGLPVVCTIVCNGPSVKDHECSNVVGNCGCGHAEPRAVMAMLKRAEVPDHLVMFCTYSPCTNCANIIIDSGIIHTVVYDILTDHDKRGEELLRKAGIRVITRKELAES